jgi:NAD(P)H dehydrogenase (quinone)
MTIAVTGASGQLGRLIITRLKTATTEPIVALARDPAKVADLGVETRAFDYNVPATLAPALTDVDTLLLISASEPGKRAVQHANVIAAARAARVGRIVYTSILHADVSAISLADEHRATEAAILASGLPHTFLRNGWYIENYVGGIAGALAHGALIGAAGEGRISAAPRADYAEAAVAVLTTPGHDGKVYELAGDTAFTLADLAAAVSAQTGKAIPYVNLSEADYAAALVGAGLPEGLAAAIAGWDTPISKGALFETSGQLSQLTGRPTTSLNAALPGLIS